MRELILVLCAPLYLTACANGPSCNDPKVLPKLDNRFLQTDSIVTISNDTATGNLRCHAKIVGALAYDGLDYTVMQTSSGDLVVESDMTGRTM
jgi:hypothetical protein